MNTQANIIPTPVALPPVSKDIFKNFEAFRVGPESDFMAGATKTSDNVFVGKPKPNGWFMTDPSRSLTTTLYEDKDNTRQFFLVTSRMAAKLRDQGALTLATLVPYVNRSKDVGLWPVKIPLDGSGSNPWYETAAEAAKAASTQWTRLFSDTKAGFYRFQNPLGKLPEPEWPEIEMSELLEMGFGDRVIDSDDHPVMNQLLGRV